MPTATPTQLLPAVQDFLAQRPIPAFIDGRWETLGRTFAVRDPGTGEIIAEVSEAADADVDRAVSAARRAFEQSGWARMPAKERSELLHRLADLVDRDADVLAQLESLDVGKPLAQAAGFDVPNLAQTLRWYADLATHTPLSTPIETPGHEARQVRVPYGVAAFVLPWNFPLLLLGWNLSPALAAGNTVVLKPAEDTPLSSLYLCRLVGEAGIPAGVINVVPGLGPVAGQALSQHSGINRMGFTGSPEVGRRVAEACGRNLVPVKLELGGKGAAVVFEDADVAAAAQQLVGAVTLNTGQVCCTATRWLVQDDCWETFVAAAKGALDGLRIGHGLDPETQMGPAVSEKQRQRILTYIDAGLQEGATAVVAGGPAEVPGFPGGFYVKPTLLAGGADNVCAQEEIFGPVAFLIRFEGEDDAINIVNGSGYGLANSVWSGDLSRATRVAEALVAGNSWINAHNLFPPGVPYAGCNLSGMGGGVLGADTLLDYLRPQSIVRPVG